jgi:hypothetical protein
MREARPLLRESTATELMQLHAATMELERTTGRLSGAAARRQLRQARAAEQDLLRVLGFRTFDEFVSVTDVHRTEPEISLVEEVVVEEVVVEEVAVDDAPQDDVVILRGEVQAALEEVRLLRDLATEVREQLSAAADVMATRLEAIVAAVRRDRAQE